MFWPDACAAARLSPWLGAGLGLHALFLSSLCVSRGRVVGDSGCTYVLRVWVLCIAAVGSPRAGCLSQLPFLAQAGCPKPGGYAAQLALLLY